MTTTNRPKNVSHSDKGFTYLGFLGDLKGKTICHRLSKVVFTQAMKHYMLSLLPAVAI